MTVGSNETAVGFCCEPLDRADGYTWTLTTRLGQFLRELEEEFGPRDKNYTPIGVEISLGDDGPMTWYPGDCGNVSILLSKAAKDNPRQAVFQLAHEVVHLLSPSGSRKARVIEEGLATLFSRRISDRLGLNMSPQGKNYLAAEALTIFFLKDRPDAIKRLREIEPSFDKFTAELIEAQYPGLEEGLATALCVRFADLFPEVK